MTRCVHCGVTFGPGSIAYMRGRGRHESCYCLPCIRQTRPSTGLWRSMFAGVALIVGVGLVIYAALRLWGHA
jgi:hypothetical protein